MHSNVADCGRRLHQCTGMWRTVVEGYINAQECGGLWQKVTSMHRNLADCGRRLHQCIQELGGLWYKVTSMHRNLADCGRRLHQCIVMWRTVVAGYINAQELGGLWQKLHQCIGTWQKVVEDCIDTQHAVGTSFQCIRRSSTMHQSYKWPNESLPTHVTYNQMVIGKSGYQ